MGRLAGFLRVALSTKERTAAMESRSERHSLSLNQAVVSQRGGIAGEINSLAGGFEGD